MQLCDMNPFLRYAELQPSAVTSAPLSCAYDYRIFYIIEGEADLVLECGRIALRAGTILYFRPAMPYYFDGKVKVIVLNFDMTRAKAHIKNPIKPSKTVKSFETALIFENDPPKELENLIAIENAFEVKEKMQQCLAHYCYPSAHSDALTSSLLKEILCYIVENANAKIPEINVTVQKINLYIQQNYDRDISNSEISAEFGYHSFYLNRIFKKITGITIHQAVIKEKIRVAKRLLKETDLSIGVISDEVGFTDSSQFCTAFRNHTGLSPKEYRKKKTAVIHPQSDS